MLIARPGRRHAARPPIHVSNFGLPFSKDLLDMSGEGGK